MTKRDFPLSSCSRLLNFVENKQIATIITKCPGIKGIVFYICGDGELKVTFDSGDRVMV